jgi:hypothetical protein
VLVPVFRAATGRVEVGKTVRINRKCAIDGSQQAGGDGQAVEARPDEEIAEAKHGKRSLRLAVGNDVNVMNVVSMLTAFDTGSR